MYSHTKLAAHEPLERNRLVHRRTSAESDDLEDGSLAESTDSDVEDIIKDSQEAPIEEDTYGYAIAAIVRDVGWLQKGTTIPCLRVSRLISAILLMLTTIVLQILIIFFVRQLLTATAVHRIRDLYSKYEETMYPNHTTILTHHAGLEYHQGIEGYRVDENFDMFSEIEKIKLCAIPLTQPIYLCTILFVWSMTCMQQIREVKKKSVRLILKVATVKSMDASTKALDEDPAVQVIIGLTCFVKFLLVLLVLVPQVIMTCILCWLGSRWMVATTDLQELILNAVALEFVLLLKEGMYQVLVPSRSKIEVQSTYILKEKHDSHARKASIWQFFSSFLWGVGALAWVLFYVFYYQHVLVDYKWDVGDICSPYLEAERKV